MTADNIRKVVSCQGKTRIVELDDGRVQSRSDGSVSWRNNNPGNLKFVYANSADKTVHSSRSRAEALVDAQQVYRGVVGLDQWGNAVFESYEAGRAAKIQLLEKKHRGKTVEQMLLSYSTADYTGGTHHRAQADFIYRQADRSGVDLRSKTIGQMDTLELAALADGIKGFEGWKVGETRQLVAGERWQQVDVVKATASELSSPQPASRPKAPSVDLASAVASSHAEPIRPGAIHHGAHGHQIEWLQNFLKKLGYHGNHGHHLVADGAFGHNTKHAVMAFQQAHHLHADGIVGRHTLAALEHARHSPLLSEATHPQHALYAQALHGVRKLPEAMFGGARAQHNAAATLTVAAHAGGLHRIDHVVLGTDAIRLFAVQGRMDDPAHRRAHVDRLQAVSQTVEHATLAMQRTAMAQEPAIHAHAFAAAHAAVDHRGATPGMQP